MGAQNFLEPNKRRVLGARPVLVGPPLLSSRSEQCKALRRYFHRTVGESFSPFLADSSRGGPLLRKPYVRLPQQVETVAAVTKPPNHAEATRAPSLNGLREGLLSAFLPQLIHLRQGGRHRGQFSDREADDRQHVTTTVACCMMSGCDATLLTPWHGTRSA